MSFLFLNLKQSGLNDTIATSVAGPDLSLCIKNFLHTWYKVSYLFKIFCIPKSI